MKNKHVVMLYYSLWLGGKEVKQENACVIKIYPYGRHSGKYMTVFYNTVIDGLVVRKMELHGLDAVFFREKYSLRLLFNSNNRT